MPPLKTPLHTTFSIQTACKINLSLLVYRKRPDGYHPLCSVFQALDWFDTMTIHLKPKSYGTWIHCSSQPDLEKDNLLLKIAAQFKQKIPFGLEIHLDKQIPMGAGLGGGSGNAAGFLLFLNQICEWKKPISSLIKTGKSFGADIPFFLQTSPALVRGIGEKITLLSEQKDRHYVLINPGLHLSTSRIFSIFDGLGTAKNPGPTPATFLTSHQGPNSLTEAAYRAEPQLALFAQQCLNLRVPNFQMTGSGSTHFIVLQNRREALLWEGRLQAAFPAYTVKALQPIRYPIQIKESPKHP